MAPPPSTTTRRQTPRSTSSPLLRRRCPSRPRPACSRGSVSWVPTFVLVTLVAGISLPSWLGLLLMAWFVGGFVFLVASMKPDPGGGSDDGARI